MPIWPCQTAGGAGELPRQLVSELLAAATAAPSMHNTQPWRFRVLPAAATIELYADPERMLRIGDPSGRAVHIACGAALLNLRLAAAVAGREPWCSCFPTQTSRCCWPLSAWPDRVRPDRTSGSCTPRSLAGHTTEVHSAAARCRLESWPNSPTRGGRGLHLHLLDREETARVLYLARDAERDLLADPGYRAELARWAGGPRDRDGMPDSALAPRSPDCPAPVREFAPGRPAPTGYAWFEEHPQLAVLSTTSGGKADWLRAAKRCNGCC